MPNLFSVSGYKIFFWSDDAKEPVHVHVSKGKPTPNSTKLWLTSAGGIIVAHNKSQIPAKELNELLEFIQAQFFLICAEWKRHFKTDEINFYC